MWLAIVLLLLVTCTVLAVLSAGHALLYKRDPRAQLSWLLTLLLLPLLGLIAYWIFGVNRIRRRGRRMRGLPEVPPPLKPARRRELPVADAPVGVEALRILCDRVTRRPVRAGNAVSPLVDGEGAYPVMLEAIAAAMRSVCLSTYIFDGDEVGGAFADALRKAVARGAQVRVLVDGIGEKYSDVSIFRRLQGVPAARFNPVKVFGRAAAYMNMRSHRKLLVVDGERGFTGGMNIGGRHLAARVENPERVRDLHFHVSGPMVVDLLDVFADDWEFTTGERLAGEAWAPRARSAGLVEGRVISDGPDEDFEKTHWILLGALACARRSVRAMSPYFIPSRALIGALGTAALRGVNVEIVLPATNNLRFVHYATQAYLWELLQQGVRVYYQPGPFVHTKYLLVDDTYSLVGSTNLDPRSLRLNFELNMELYDADSVGAFLRAHFEAARAQSAPVTDADVASESTAARLRNAVAKLFSPYL